MFLLFSPGLFTLNVPTWASQKNHTHYPISKNGFFFFPGKNIRSLQELMVCLVISLISTLHRHFLKCCAVGFFFFLFCSNHSFWKLWSKKATEDNRRSLSLVSSPALIGSRRDAPVNETCAAIASAPCLPQAPPAVPGQALCKAMKPLPAIALLMLDNKGENRRRLKHVEHPHISTQNLISPLSSYFQPFKIPLAAS